MCIVPLPFSVNAAEIDELSPQGINCACINPTYTALAYGDPTYQVLDSSADTCYIQYYTWIQFKCNSCWIYVTVDGAGKAYTHPSFILTDKSGVGDWVYICSKCGYEKAA